MAFRLTGRKDPDDDRGGSSGSGFRNLVMTLILLDIIAGGFYGWLVMIKGKEVMSTRQGAENNLVRVKQMGEAIRQQVEVLYSAETLSVKDPKNPINRAARHFQLFDNIVISDPVRRPWGRDGRYDSYMVKVQFRESIGYKFSGIISFIRRIEKTSPKVQVSAVNFGKRDDGDDTWRPAFIDVRVFKPRSKRRGT